MDYKIYVTVHVYVEEQLDTAVLKPHNKNYGINGKEIIAPLRKINGMEYCIGNVADEFTVEELWNWIDFKICGNTLEYSFNKYLVFDNVRYRVENTKLPLSYYLDKMHYNVEDTINIQILLSENAGEVFKDDGIRYYMHSKEAGKHNEPHVHVNVRYEHDGTFSIIDGRQLEHSDIRPKDIRKIQMKIKENKEQLIEYWNLHTDGLTVDLNQKWGLIHY